MFQIRESEKNITLCWVTLSYSKTSHQIPSSSDGLRSPIWDNIILRCQALNSRYHLLSNTPKELSAKNNNKEIPSSWIRKWWDLILTPIYFNAKWSYAWSNISVANRTHIQDWAYFTNAFFLACLEFEGNSIHQHQMATDLCTLSEDMGESQIEITSNLNYDRKILD